MPLKIQLSSEKVPLGKSIRVLVQDTASPTPPSLSWTVEPLKAGTMAGDGTFTASSARPSKNMVTLTGTHATTGEVVTATIELILPWPEGWPYLSDEGLPWPEPVRDWAARVLYDVLSTAPKELVEEMGPVPIILIEELHGSGARYNSYHFTSHMVEFPQAAIQHFLGTGASTPMSNLYQGLGDLLLHELAHVVMSNRCGGHAKRLLDVSTTLNAVSGALYKQVLSIATEFIRLPLLPVELFVGGIVADAYEKATHDFMSDFCEASDWVMNNWSAAHVPLLGLMLPWLQTQRPNYVAATMPTWLLNMRNEPLQTHHDALEARHQAGDTTVATTLSNAGFASRYATRTPQEDFAETVLFSVVGNTRVVHTEEPRGVLSQRRRDFLVNNKLLPAKWNPTTEHLYDLTNLELAKNGPWWRVDSTPPAPTAASTASLQTQRQQAAALTTLFATWEDGAGKHLERNRTLLQGLLPDAEAATTLGLARAAELHGDGLRRYAESEAVPHRATPGDLLLGKDTTVWMVTDVDAQGRVAQATGRVGLEPGTTAASLVTPKSELAYHWPPSGEPRRFASADTASPHYPDLDGALRKAIGLWGREETPDGPRDLRTMGGFLREFLSLARLKPEDAELDASGRVEDVLAYLDTHGEGLQPYTPGGVRVRVGDVLVPYHRNTLAVVTRVNERGEPVDVLLGGTHEPGLLGEPAGAVKMSHQADPRDFHFHWVPSTRARAWTAPEESMRTVLTDLNASLNHLRRHVGQDEVRRGEKTYDVSKHSLFQVGLALMLEREPAPAVRKKLGPLGWEAPSHLLRNHLYTHAGVRGRAPVRPGDFFRWMDAGGVTREGIALEVGPAGEPVETFTVNDKGVLTLLEESLALDALTEVCTLSLEPRELVEQPPARAFYGSPSALTAFVTRRDPSSQWEDVLYDGDRTTRSYGKPEDFAKLLAVKAPAWVRARLMPRSTFEGIRVVLDTLGDGLVPYAQGTKLPVGTWVFTQDGGLGVVLSTTADGLPGALFMMAPEGLDFVPFDAADAAAFWQPAVTPRRYTEELNTEAYTDLGAELGRLRLWCYIRGGETVGENPFFKHAALLDELNQQPALVAMLKAGPTSTNDWIVYLMDFGDGIQRGAQPRPGDFLFLEGGDDERGIALDRGEMIWWSDDELLIGPLQRVKYLWRPTPKRRAARTA